MKVGDRNFDTTTHAGRCDLAIEMSTTVTKGMLVPVGKQLDTDARLDVFAQFLSGLAGTFTAALGVAEAASLFRKAATLIETEGPAAEAAREAVAPTHAAPGRVQ